MAVGWRCVCTSYITVFTCIMNTVFFLDSPHSFLGEWGVRSLCGKCIEKSWEKVRGSQETLEEA